MSKVGSVRDHRAQPRRQIKQRPRGYDFDWYLRDLVKEARACGFQNILTYEQAVGTGAVAEGDIRSWKDLIGKVQKILNIDQLQTDWCSYLRGDQTLNAVSNAQHCFDNLLPDDSFVANNRSAMNAQALSDAIRQVLPLEHGRYVSSREEEIAAILNSHQWVTQKKAGECLNIDKPVTTRWVRQLADERRLERNNAGKISTASIRAYLKKEKSLILC